MFKYATGQRMNLIGRGAGYGASATGVALGAGSADSLFPLANLYDGRPSRAMRLSAVSTGFYVSWPNNLVVNGDMEQSSLTGWTAVSTTLTSETGAGNFHKGVRSIKLVNSSAFGYVYQDVTVRAGEYLQIWAAAKSDGTNAAKVIVRCLQTNKDVKSDGTWGAASQVVMTKTANTMAAFTPVAFRVPTFSELGSTTATLRIYLMGDANGQTHYWDEVLLVPGVNFIGAFGHNLDASTGLALATFGSNYWHSPSSSASFGSSGNAAFALGQRVHVLNSTLVYDPFLGIFVYPGAAFATYSTTQIPYIGELVAAQVTDFPKNPNFPVTMTEIEPLSRQATPAGEVFSYRTGGSPVRELRMPFTFKNQTQYDTFRTEFYGMSRGGQYPTIIIPTETHPNDVLYGRIKETSVQYTRDNNVERKAEFSLIESPLAFME